MKTYTTNGTDTNGKCGSSGMITGGTYQVDITIESQAIYLLVANQITVSTGAQRGSVCYMVVGGSQDVSSSSPVSVQLGTNGTPPTVSTVSGNIVRISNGGTTYCTQFNLIRIA